jgi:alpha-tubulin suppressor-like RCC1 family protein
LNLIQKAGELGTGDNVNTVVPVEINFSVGVTSIFAGRSHSMIIKDGDVYAFGGSDVNRLYNNFLSLVLLVWV